MQRQEPNVHGAYVTGVEKVKVPLSKQLSCELDLNVVLCNDGLWRWGYAFRDGRGGGGCAAPSQKNKGYACRSAALQGGAEWYRGAQQFVPSSLTLLNIFAADIAKFIESLPMSAEMRAALDAAGEPAPVAKHAVKPQRYEQLSLW